jgi:hypothetical protein
VRGQQRRLRHGAGGDPGGAQPSYDRDIDCPAGPALPVGNSIGGAGPHGFLERFLGAGL